MDKHVTGGLARPPALRRAIRAILLLAFSGMAVFVPVALADSAPSNSSLPTITGTPQQGSTLTAQSGGWTGTNPIVFTYKWRKCDGAGAACTDIAGATGQTYTIAASAVPVGSTLRVSVSATNGTGTGTALSDSSAAVTAANAPQNTSLPSISGTAQEGSTLTAGNGSWSGAQPIAYSYQWFHCDGGGGNCSAIGGATHQTYMPTASDVHNTVRAEVIASNSSGSTPALSGSSSVIASAGSSPANTSIPSLSGTVMEGSTLTVSQGSWQGASPISYASGWQRCDASGNNCATISGANDASYKLARADVGNRVRGAVTASNGVGTTTAYTSLSAIVGSQLEPVNTSPPTISGAAAVGQTLRGSVGAWSGKAPIQFFYQWARSNSKGGFDPISQATNQSYKLTSADLGHKLFVQVKAQNSYGPAWVDSTPTATVTVTVPGVAAVPVSSIALPDRLVISKVKFTPSVLRTQGAFRGRFEVTDSAGKPVQGALVYVLGLPRGWLRGTPEQQTGADGSVTFTILPTTKLPIGHPGAIVMFVRARKPGGSVLGGVSTRRLVQARIR